MRYFLRIILCMTVANLGALNVSAITAGSIEFEGSAVSKTICSNDPLPTVLSKTLPSSYVGTASYSWKKNTSSDGVAWLGWENVDGSTDESLTLSGLSVGFYQFKRIDADETPLSAETNIVSLQIADKPSVSFPTLTPPSCIADGVLVAKGAGGKPKPTGSSYTYTWGGSYGTKTSDSSWSALAGGTYALTVTDANGCYKTATQTLDVYKQISLSPSKLVQPVCNASNIAGNGTITVVETGGNTNLEYSINAVFQNSNVFSNVSPGTYTVTVRDKTYNTCDETESVTINSISHPVVSITETHPVTCAGSDGVLTASVSPVGISPFSYNWDGTPKLTGEKTNLSPGLYTVTVTDGNNCFTTASATLDAYNLAFGTAEAVQPQCIGGAVIDGSIPLQPSGGSGQYQYSSSSSAAWVDFLGATATITDLNNDTVKVRVRDKIYNGCLVEKTFIINPLSAPTVAFTSVVQPTCSNNNGQLTALGSGGSPKSGSKPYEYKWSNTATNNSISNCIEGNYSVTVTDSKGCSGYKDTALSMPATKPTIKVNRVENSVCGTTGLIAIDANGTTGPYTITLTRVGVPVSGTSNGYYAEFPNLAAADYTVTVQDANSCSATENVPVDNNGLSISAITPLQSSCKDENTIDVDAAGGSGFFEYSLNGTDYQSSSVFSLLKAQNYTVYARDLYKKTCIVSKSHTVVAPDAPVITMPTVIKVLCNGASTGSISVTVHSGNAPYSYMWTDASNKLVGANSAELAGQPAGTYQLVVTDGKKCTATLLPVTIAENPMLTASFSKTDVAIFGASTGSITATPSGGVAPYIYNWSNSGSSQTIQNIPAGTYTVTVTDNVGCSFVGSETITSSTALSGGEIKFNNNALNFSFCDNGSPVAIVSNSPASGGTVPIVYSWQSSSDQVTWAVIAGETGVGLSVAKIQQLVATPQTMYVQRVATDKNAVKAMSNIVSITRNPLPVVTIVGLKNSYCTNEQEATIQAYPATSAGYFTPAAGLVIGVNGSATLAPSNFLNGGTVKYTFTDYNGCISSLSKPVTIFDTTLVSVSINSIVAFNSASENISVSPHGGVLSGPGVYSAGEMFFPQYAGRDTHEIKYTYTNSFGCVSVTKDTVIVRDAPANIGFELAHNNVFCVTDNPIKLIAVPTVDVIDSVWGKGVTFNKGDDFAYFNPSIAGGGVHTVSMTFHKSNVLYNVNSSFTVVDVGDPSIIGMKTGYCESNVPIPLKGATPNGVFTGNNVANEAYTPIIRFSGSKDIITYTLSDNSAKCYKSASVSVNVYQLPVVSLSNCRTIFNSNEPSYEVKATPVKGFFSVNGVSQGLNNIFRPVDINSGPVTVSYSYTDNNSCVNSVDTIWKIEDATATIDNLPSQICVENDTITIYAKGNAFTGFRNFKGPGIVKSFAGDSAYFVPKLAGVGTHSIIYTYYSAAEAGDSAMFLVTKAISVIQAAKPAIVTDKATYCDGDEAEFTAKAGNLSPIGDFKIDGITLSGYNNFKKQLNPSISEVAFTYSDANNCIASDTIALKVHSLPQIYSVYVLPYYNHDASTATIVANPPTGVFTSTSLSIVFNGNTFDPSHANLGIDTIRYTVTDANGCVSHKESYTELVSPTVSFTSSKGLFQHCRVAADSAVITVVENRFKKNGTFTPAAGIMDLGNNSVKIYPDKVVGDSVVLIFNYTSPDGLTNFSAKQTVYVETPVSVSFSAIDDNYCRTEAKQTVEVDNKIATGTHVFKYNGAEGLGLVSQSNYSAQLSPLFLNPGENTLSYHFTSTNGCQSSVSKLVNVVDVPVLDFSIKKVFNIDELPVELKGNLAGVFEGTDGTVSQKDTKYFFDPSKSDGPVQTIKYVAADVNGCKNEKLVTVNVFSADAKFIGLDSVYCESDAIDTILVEHLRPHAHGRFVIDNTIYTGDTLIVNPSMFASGVHAIHYLYTDNDSLATFETKSTFSIFSFGKLSINGLSDVYCKYNDEVLLSGVPLGGTFSGDGILNGYFNPSKAIKDTVFVKYAVQVMFPTKNNADKVCQDVFSKQVLIRQLPSIQMFGINDNMKICALDTIVLKSSHSGGKFAGANVFQASDWADSALFTPSRLSIGNQQITLSYTDPQSTCTNVDTVNILVRSTPLLAIKGLAEQYCADSDSIELVGEIDGTISSAGYFSGISGSTAEYIITADGKPVFVPSQAVLDNQSTAVYIQYSFANANECESTITQKVRVNPMPEVKLDGYKTSYCQGEPPVYLVGSQSGSKAIYTLNGLSGTTNNKITFDNPDTVYIAFEYTDANGCYDKVSDKIIIHPLPVVDFTYNTQCMEDTLHFSNATTSVDTIKAYNWLFDSVSAVAENAQYKFMFPGYHLVRLLATTTNSCSASKDSLINFFGAPWFTVSADAVCDKGATQFKIVSTSNELSEFNYSWDFGDGETSNDESPDHIYPNPGIYSASLTLSANGKCTSTKETLVRVKPIIDSFPYLEDFDNGAGDWFSIADSANSWTLYEYSFYGSISNLPERCLTDVSGDVSSAHKMVWATQNRDTLGYTKDERSYIEGPCFNLNNLSKPMLSFMMSQDMEKDREGIVLEYSTATNKSWQVVGKREEGIGWYNSNVIASRPGSQSLNLGWTGEINFDYSAIKLDNLYTLQDSAANIVSFRLSLAAEDANEKYSGPKFDEFSVRERETKVLVEDFLSLERSYALDVDSTLNSNKDFVYVQYHTGSFGDDPYYKQFPQPANARSTFYSEFLTTTLINGKNQAIDQNFDYEVLSKPAFDISVVSDFNISPASVTISMKANKYTVLDYGNLFVLLIEKDFPNDTLGVVNVVRAILPNTSGIEIQDEWCAGDSFTTTLSIPENAKYDRSKLSIVAFVQDLYDTNVYGSAVDSRYPSSISTVYKQPKSAVADRYFYPNPANKQLYVTSEGLSSPSIRINSLLGASVAVHDGAVLYIGALPPGSYYASLYDGSVHIKTELITIER